MDIAMLKKLLISLGILSVLAGPVQAAGSISLSLSQQFDSLGHPLNGGLLYTYAAGTTTPQSAYQDSALTIPYPNPITLDSAGRVPQLFFADGSIKVRLTNAAGTVQLAQDGILVIGASSGGGGGSPVDATTILQTGDYKSRHGTGNLTGFVRCNGRTIGSATSGATERANSDTQALFEYFWSADSNLSVSGGRGASANADWVANKALTLPDCRGRVLAGMDDMGNSAASRLTVTYFGQFATTLGAASGAESHTLITAEIPSHTHSNTLTDPGHQHQLPASNAGTSFAGGGSNLTNPNGSLVNNSPTTLSATTGISINNAAAGGGGAHAIVQPTMVITWYIKL